MVALHCSISVRVAGRCEGSDFDIGRMVTLLMVVTAAIAVVTVRTTTRVD
jgi:hypothetical protein